MTLQAWCPGILSTAPSKHLWWSKQIGAAGVVSFETWHSWHRSGKWCASDLRWPSLWVQFNRVLCHPQADASDQDFLYTICTITICIGLQASASTSHFSPYISVCKSKTSSPISTHFTFLRLLRATTCQAVEQYSTATATTTGNSLWFFKNSNLLEISLSQLFILAVQSHAV